MLPLQNSLTQDWHGWPSSAVSASARAGNWRFTFSLPDQLYGGFVTGLVPGYVTVGQQPSEVEFGILVRPVAGRPSEFKYNLVSSARMMLVEPAGGGSANTIGFSVGEPLDLGAHRTIHICRIDSRLFLTAGPTEPPEGNELVIGPYVLPGTVLLAEGVGRFSGPAYMLAVFNYTSDLIHSYETAPMPGLSDGGTASLEISIPFAIQGSDTPGARGAVSIPFTVGGREQRNSPIGAFLTVPFTGLAHATDMAARALLITPVAVLARETFQQGAMLRFPLIMIDALMSAPPSSMFIDAEYVYTFGGRLPRNHSVEVSDRALLSMPLATKEVIQAVGAATSTDSIATFYRTAVEVFSAAAATLRSHLAYSVKIDESVLAILTPDTTDIVLLGDVIRAAADAMTFYRTSVEQVDTAQLATALLNSYGTNVSDMATARDLNFLQGVFDLLDRISAGDNVALGYAPSVELLDALRGDDAVVLTSVVQLLSALSAGDAVQLLDAVQLNEQLLASAEFESLRNRMVEALDAAQVLTEVRLASVFYLWEQATVETDELALLMRSVLLLDRLVADTQFVADRQLGFMIIDRAHAADELLTVAHFIQLLREGATAIATFRLGDEAFFACVMNTEGAKALSTYTNYPFNSFAQLGGRMLAAADTGLYELGGDTDDGAPINARLKSLMTDMGTSRMKRVRSAYMGYTASGRLVLKLLSVDAGQLVETWFEAHDLEADAPRAQRVQTALGLRSRYWQFELANIDGADFELDELELHPLYLNRRV